MDCAKVGRLIMQFRKEKGMTQQQVADLLGISNKTVSKWERGLGCPDVSLWDDLSTVLGADILKLIQGELSPNRPDVGKLEKTLFYVCPTCGNILVSTGTASISCCGRKLKPLISVSCSEEHKAVLREIDLEYYVTVNHDMRKDHYISFAALVYHDRIYLNRLYPEQNPEFRLPMVRKGGYLYLYCTQHGLQKCPIAQITREHERITD